MTFKPIAVASAAALKIEIVGAAASLALGLL